MSSSSFPNVYTHRKVADTSSKGCDICFRPTSSVLVTPEKQDFFYVCPSHLKDKRFCSPIIDQAAIEAKKKKEMDDEIARLKKEYEEKQKKKKEKEKEKEKEKDKEKDNDKEKEKDMDKGDKKDEKEDESSKSTEKDKADKEAEASKEEEEPRVFALQRNFYTQRVDKKRQAEMAKRNRERLRDPNFFPSVPKGLP